MLLTAVCLGQTMKPSISGAKLNVDETYYNLFDNSHDKFTNFSVENMV